MKYYQTLWVFILSGLLHSLRAQSEDPALADAFAVKVRAGLPNVAALLPKKDTIRIAYLGGSITEAAHGWREQSRARLREMYPGVPFLEIPAAIGGTGSDLGAFRLREQVLNHHPDLIFVEFAVNDNGKSIESVVRSMEGIVRQTWRELPRTDLCFVYTLMASMAPVLEKGKLPLSATAMEKVADYYGIPSVHLGLEVVELARQGKLVYQGKPEEQPDKLVFSPDNVHPYSQTGHRLYTEALLRAFPALLRTQSPLTHSPGKPLDTLNLERAMMLPVTDVSKSTGWTKITPGTDSVAMLLRNRFDELYKASRPGETLTIRFEGTQLGLYDVMGPGCGQYEVRVDGGPPTLISRFDAYSTYYRSNFFLLPRLPEGEHVVELKVAPVPPDKATILKQRNQTIQQPARYAENACYAGKLLLVGRLLP